MHKTSTATAAAAAAAAAKRSYTMPSFAQLKFDNRSLRELPVDRSYAQTQNKDIPNVIFALVRPTSVANPRLIAHSTAVARDLLEVEIDPKADTDMLCGNIPPSDNNSAIQMAAHCYAGHQFGSFSGQLGDGATMYLGETVNSKQERWEVQYKGAGITPFSRGADGRKVLRSSIREFLCSEHMHALGIPTTRALSICDTDTTVVRDMFYDGHPTRERCAVIVRVAPSFLRFGSFEIAKKTDRITGRAGPSPGNYELIRNLFGYVQRHFFTEQQGSAPPPQDTVLEIARRTGVLIAQWQCVGFCHGVMNTDNMSILGLTMDYGPFGFMERFDPHFVPNLSDHGASYRFEAQPTVGLFNLRVLAGELGKAGLEVDETALEQTYRDAFFGEFRTRMFAKLGFVGGAEEQLPSKDFVFELLTAMHRSGADYTMTFRALAEMQSIADFDAHLRPCCLEGDASKEHWEAWLGKYFDLIRTTHSEDARRERMNSVNPVFVLRNHVAQRAIDEAEQGNYEELNRVLRFCCNPFDETQPELLARNYHKPSKQAKCNAVSCSS